MRTTPHPTTGFLARIPRLLARCLLVGALVPVFGLAPSVRAEADDAERLRQAWILHRLESKPGDAEKAYRELFEDAAVDPDVRLRSGIGLGLIERSRGSEANANRWFMAAYQVPDASSRWVRAAFELVRSTEDALSPRAELETQVEELRATLLLVRETLTERDQELSSGRDLIARLQEQRKYDLAVEARELEARSAADRYAESLLRHDREDQKFRHKYVQRALYRALEDYSQGRFLSAHNGAKRVLAFDPTNRDALDLAGDCRRYLAQTIGRRSVPPPSSTTHRGKDVSTLIEEAMSAYLNEGKRAYRAGKTGEAIDHFQNVLEEFTWSPVPLREEVVDTIVRPAEAELRKCFAEQGAGAELQARWDEKKELDKLLKDSLDDLIEREDALAEGSSDIERLRSDDPALELERVLHVARRARDASEREKAARGFEKALEILEKNPALDRDGTKKKVRDELAELKESSDRR